MGLRWFKWYRALRGGHWYFFRNTWHRLPYLRPESEEHYDGHPDPWTA